MFAFYISFRAFQHSFGDCVLVFGKLAGGGQEFHGFLGEKRLFLAVSEIMYLNALIAKQSNQLDYLVQSHLHFKHLFDRSCKQLFQFCLNISCAFTVCHQKLNELLFVLSVISVFHTNLPPFFMVIIGIYIVYYSDSLCRPSGRHFSL